MNFWKTMMLAWWKCGFPRRLFGLHNFCGLIESSVYAVWKATAINVQNGVKQQERTASACFSRLRHV